MGGDSIFFWVCFVVVVILFGRAKKANKGKRSYVDSSKTFDDMDKTNSDYYNYYSQHDDPPRD